MAAVAQVGGSVEIPGLLRTQSPVVEAGVSTRVMSPEWGQCQFHRVLPAHMNHI